MSDLMQGLTEGRIVHYVLSEGRNAGQHRPAIVVRDWKEAAGTVNLQVFMDGDAGVSNDEDRTPVVGSVMWKTSVLYDESGKPGTWHWIEKA